MTMVWVVSISRLKAPSGTSSPHISPLTPSGQLRLMGVPTSEVGYTSATARRGDHDSSYEHVVTLGGRGGRKNLELQSMHPILIQRIFLSPAQ